MTTVLSRAAPVIGVTGAALYGEGKEEFSPHAPLYSAPAGAADPHSFGHYSFDFCHDASGRQRRGAAPQRATRDAAQRNQLGIFPRNGSRSDRRDGRNTSTRRAEHGPQHAQLPPLHGQPHRKAISSRWIHHSTKSSTHCLYQSAGRPA